MKMALFAKDKGCGEGFDFGFSYPLQLESIRSFRTKIRVNSYLGLLFAMSAGFFLPSEVPACDAPGGASSSSPPAESPSITRFLRCLVFGWTAPNVQDRPAPGGTDATQCGNPHG